MLSSPRSVQKSAEALVQALCQGQQMPVGLSQRVQEREDGTQPRTQRQRRQLIVSGSGHLTLLHY